MAHLSNKVIIKLVLWVIYKIIVAYLCRLCGTKMRKKYVDLQDNVWHYVGMRRNCNKIRIKKKIQIASSITNTWLTTCQMQIIYVSMQNRFVDMQLAYVHMQLIYVTMQFSYVNIQLSNVDMHSLMLTRNCFMSVYQGASCWH